MKKILGILKRIVDIVLTVFVLLFILVVCLQRFSNNEITLFGYRMFTVVSGSMEPEYNIGEVLISKETAPTEIKVGDDVSYVGSSGAFNGKVVTHRVVKIDKDVDGKLIFHTKGLANLVEDPLVYEDQLYGVVVHEAKVLSFIYKCVSTKNGMFVFIVIPILYIIGSEMIYVMLENEEKRRNKLKDNKVKEKVSSVELEEGENKRTPIKKNKKVTKK